MDLPSPAEPEIQSSGHRGQIRPTDWLWKSQWGQDQLFHPAWVPYIHEDFQRGGISSALLELELLCHEDYIYCLWIVEIHTMIWRSQQEEAVNEDSGNDIPCGGALYSYKVRIWHLGDPKKFLLLQNVGNDTKDVRVKIITFKFQNFIENGICSWSLITLWAKISC